VHKARVAIRYLCDLLNIKVGNDLLVPSYNCGSEIDPLIKSGAAVHFYRVDRSAIVDIEDLRNRITKNTKAIYVTHYFGFPQPIEKIKNLCMENGIYLIEDCALSLFSQFEGKKLGSFGDAAVFSFPKSLPVPDGGALVINNRMIKAKEWKRRKPRAIRIGRTMAALIKAGLLRTTPIQKVIYLGKLADKFVFKKTRDRVFSNLKVMPKDYYYDEQLNDTQMSMITKISLGYFEMDSIVKRRQENFKLFCELMAGYPEVKPVYSELPAGVCPLYFPIIVKNRNLIYVKLNNKFISAMPWWSGYHTGLHWDEFPDASYLKDNVLALPVHQQLESEGIRYMVETLKNIIRTG